MSKTIDSDGDKRRAAYWVHKAAKLAGYIRWKEYKRECRAKHESFMAQLLAKRDEKIMRKQFK